MVTIYGCIISNRKVDVLTAPLGARRLSLSSFLLVLLVDIVWD